MKVRSHYYPTLSELQDNYPDPNILSHCNDSCLPEGLPGLSDDKASQVKVCARSSITTRTPIFSFTATTLLSRKAYLVLATTRLLSDLTWIFFFTF
jgi:hypothetical protein